MRCQAASGFDLRPSLSVLIKHYPDDRNRFRRDHGVKAATATAARSPSQVAMMRPASLTLIVEARRKAFGRLSLNARSWCPETSLGSDYGLKD